MVLRILPNVHVGSKKAEVIRAEVDEALDNPNISGEELARIRAEVEALADRDLRRELMAKIDEAEKNLLLHKKLLMMLQKKQIRKIL